MISKAVSRIRRQLRQSPFTVTGRLLAVAWLFCFFAIFDSTLTKLLSYVTWLLLIGFGCGFFFRPKLLVKPCWLPVVFNGHRFDLQLNVTNAGRVGAYDLQLTLELPPEGLQASVLTNSIGSLAPGETVAINYSLTPTMRGEFQIERLTVASLFPLSLFRFLANYPLKHSILVAPSYESQQEIIGQVVEGLDLSESAGNSKKNSVLEYIGSREFRPGVPVRRWDFASWARLGTPSVREFSEGSDSVVVVVVDTTQRAAPVDPVLESVLTTATGIVLRLNELGESVMLITVGKAIEFCESRNSADFREEFLTRIARLKGEAAKINWTIAWDQILREAPSNATLVTVLSDPEAQRILDQSNLGSRKVITCPVAPVHRRRTAAIVPGLSEELISP